MTHRLVVVGAGYAGLIAAEQLARRMKQTATVTLVTAEPIFRERPRFHQIATGQSVRELDLSALLDASAVRLVLARVDRIDTESRSLRLCNGEQQIRYDTLVYSCGSQTVVDSIPGVSRHAYTLDDREQLGRLAARLDSCGDGTRVAVIGGGLTGIETAAEIAESIPNTRVTLVSQTEPGAHLAPRARRYLAKRLAALNVTVLAQAQVSSVHEHGLVLTDGRTVPAGIVVAAAGFIPSPLAARSGLPTDARGRVLVDRSLKVVGVEHVYAGGDACAAPGPWGDALAMGCRTGAFMGPAIAKSIRAELRGKPAPLFKYRYFHECISLGRKHAVVQFLRADETVRKVSLRGRKALRYKEATLKAATFQMRMEAKRSRRRDRPDTGNRKPTEPLRQHQSA